MSLTMPAQREARSNEPPRDDREELLFQFSEWLDGEGAMRPDDVDKRTHANLVRDFIEQLSTKEN